MLDAVMALMLQLERKEKGCSKENWDIWEAFFHINFSLVY